MGPGMAVHMQSPPKWLLGCPHTGVPDIRVIVQAVECFIYSQLQPQLKQHEAILASSSASALQSWSPLCSS